MKKYLVALWLAALLSGADAQGYVYQTGSVTPGHAVQWATTGVIQDAGTAASGTLTSLGVTNNGGPGVCLNSAPITSPYNQLCLSVSTASAAQITLQNYGGAAAQNLQFMINGTAYPFPGSLSNITIGTTPVVGGTNGSCLYVSGSTVGQQNCQLSAITSLTGDGTASGPGVSPLTLATVNGNVGTWGSGTQIPVITVNGKGLITAVSQSTVSFALGAPISGAANNEILYVASGLVSQITTANNSVLVTNGSGVPSFGTLPSAACPIATTAALGCVEGDNATLSISGGGVISLNTGNANTWSATQTFSNQINSTAARSIASASGAVLDDVKVTAETTTITGTTNITTAAGFNKVSLYQPTYNDSSSVTITTAATLYIANAPAATGSVTITNPWSLNVAAGATNLGGGGALAGTFSGSPTLSGNPTFSGDPLFSGLSSGTCSNGLAINSSNQTITVACPGASTTIQVGSTSVTSGTGGYILYNNSGTLGNETFASAASGQTLTGTLAIPTADLRINGSSTGYTAVASANASSSNYTWTLPADTDTFAGLTVTDQTLSGGANVTAYQDTISGSALTVDCGKGPLQYVFNTGAFTLTAPTSDASCVLEVINASGSSSNPNGGAITLAGNFSVKSPAGVTFANTLTQSAVSCTVTSASPGVITWTAHGLTANTPIYLTGTTAPTGLTKDVVYYVVGSAITTNTIEISATPGGAAINTSSTGTSVTCNEPSVYDLSLTSINNSVFGIWAQVQ